MKTELMFQYLEVIFLNVFTTRYAQYVKDQQQAFCIQTERSTICLLVIFFLIIDFNLYPMTANFNNHSFIHLV